MSIFRHAIGKSTLTEGITVPRAFERWMEAPEPGQKRELTLLFDDMQIRATLRRLANARGHVQVKYENKEGLPFRQWLVNVFTASRSGMRGEYLELQRIEADVFRVVAFPVSCQPALHLEISEWIFHRSDERVFKRLAPVREIPAIIYNVELKIHEGQRYYNRQLAQLFTEWNWQSEKRVVPELPLKSDFMKGGVQVEVEFGNARAYYQDYIKFMLASHYKASQFGILIVPTEGFCALAM